jgi:hypothetical protein
MNKTDDMQYCDKLDEIGSHPHGKQIYEIIGWYCSKNTDADKIAKYLNGCNLKTFSGNERWTKKEVLEVLDEVCKDRFLYFKVICGC